MSDRIKVVYFTDILCVWAYIAQKRIDELRANWGDRIEIEYRFIPVFGAVHRKVERQWKEKGGLDWYNGHVREICNNYDHVEVHDRIWLDVVPESSAPVHAFLKAAQLHWNKNNDAPYEELLWQTRQAFFQHGRDISDRRVQESLARDCKIDLDAIDHYLDTGQAMAAMCEDLELRDDNRVKMSPTIVLNEGRQMLNGNVGYRVIDANLREILDRPIDMASWC